MSIWQIGESGTEIPIDDSGEGEVSFTVTNTGPTQARAMLIVEPLDGAAKEWFTVPEPQKAVVSTQSVTYVCKVKVPPGTPPATYALEAIVYSADEVPDDLATKSRRITFVVPPIPVAPNGKPKWWLFVIIGVVVLAVIAGALFFILGGDGNGPPPPTTTTTTTGPTTTAGPGFTNTEPPAISGTAQVGAVLETTNGSWSVAPSGLAFSYQWERCSSTDDSSCAPIDQAVTSAYQAAPEDEGTTLRVVVGARDADAAEAAADAALSTDPSVSAGTADTAVAPAVTATSARTGVVAPRPPEPPVPVPSVIGDPLSVARGKLTALGFPVGLITDEDVLGTFDCNPPVVRQAPLANTPHDVDDTVFIFVPQILRWDCHIELLKEAILLDDDILRDFRVVEP